MRISAMIGTFLFCIILPNSVQAQAVAPEATEALPSVMLKDLDGAQVDLRSFVGDGKPTIISFWATWCSPCKRELDNMNVMLPEWEAAYGVKLVAISIDDARNSMRVKPYVNGKSWKFPVLLDINGDTKRLLNYTNVPFTLLVDGAGNVIYKHIGYTDGDEAVLEEKLKELK